MFDDDENEIIANRDDVHTHTEHIQPQENMYRLSAEK